MAGFLIKISDAELQRKITALNSGLVDATPLLRVWGEIALTSIQQNFEVGGRPTWKTLSDVTIALKGHDKKLIGRTNNLRRITYKIQAPKLIVGTAPSARDYAAIQQFGGKAGRNLKVVIPARPYLVLQEEDKAEMRRESIHYLRRLAS